jgi:hypothetical protein
MPAPLARAKSTYQEPSVVPITLRPTAMCDLPPLKWSSLKYDFRTEDKVNGEEEAYG